MIELIRTMLEQLSPSEVEAFIQTFASNLDGYSVETVRAVVEAILG